MELLYENIDQAFSRKDIDLLYRIWQESVEMGTTGEVIRAIITSHVRDLDPKANTFQAVVKRRNARDVRHMTKLYEEYSPLLFEFIESNGVRAANLFVRKVLGLSFRRGYNIEYHYKLYSLLLENSTLESDVIKSLARSGLNPWKLTSCSSYECFKEIVDSQAYVRFAEHDEVYPEYTMRYIKEDLPVRLNSMVAQSLITSQ